MSNFCFGHTYEFEIWWQLWIVGFCNFPTSSTLPRSALGGSSVNPQVYGIKCWSFLHVFSTVPFTLTSKGPALAIPSSFFCLDQKTEWETQREHLFFFSFLFSAKGERVKPVSTKVEKVTEFFGQIEREIGPFLILFHCLQPRVREWERESGRQGLVRECITSLFP